jgi:hypothetical protein
MVRQRARPLPRRPAKLHLSRGRAGPRSSPGEGLSGTQPVTEEQDLIMTAHRTADPEVKVLRHDGNALQDGRSHPDYLKRNPCFTETEMSCRSGAPRD